MTIFKEIAVFIKNYKSINGRDFYADMECEHCGNIQKIESGYNDNYYHNHVIPAMTCVKCHKNRSGVVPPKSNDFGQKFVGE